MLEEISQYEKEQRERIEDRMLFQIKNVKKIKFIMSVKLPKETLYISKEVPNWKNKIQLESHYFHTAYQYTFPELMDKIDEKMGESINCSQKKSQADSQRSANEMVSVLSEAGVNQSQTPSNQEQPQIPNFFEKIQSCHNLE